MPRSARLALLSVLLGATCARNSGASDALPRVPGGFTIEAIAHVPAARELSAAPNGDLFVGTNSSDIYIVPAATGAPLPPRVFVTMSDTHAAGVALWGNALYVGTHEGVWRLVYRSGDRTAPTAPQKLAAVRTGQGDGHTTTSVAIDGAHLYASVGSSCDACDESDPTRATVGEVPENGGTFRVRASHIRNAIALAIEPSSHDLWAGVAGQDALEHGHPYEIFDDVSAHAGVPDYGWPRCYENRKAVQPGTDCSNAVVPRAVFPAYATPIGAAFYPRELHGAQVFPAAWRDGAYVGLHGSWHQPLVPPRVVFVPFVDGLPRRAVDWKDPNVQWRSFVDGFQVADQSRIGRPTGIAVGPDGSLFVADDLADVIYRIRPRR